MVLTNRRILLISPDPWDHIFVSKHHYAIHLGRLANTVFFLNPPGQTDGVTPTQFQNVFEVNYKGFPPGLRFYPAFLQKKIIGNVYRKLEKACKTVFQIVWSFDNSVFFDFSALPASAIKISHIVDGNQNFQTQKAASTADYCFCVSEHIRIRLRRYNDKVYKINHGFNCVDGVGRNDSKNYRGKIKAVYAGNLSIPYIDWDLLSLIIADHSDVDFLFIGPHAGNANTRRFAEKENVFFVGRVESDELLAYYQMADILLVSYQEKYQDGQVSNTHKMMEYLGSGKVIVATKTPEYENLYPLIVMSEKNSEWPALFGKVAANVGIYNSSSLRQERTALALNNTYDLQINRIEQIISD
jgi:hypothetical protein